MFKRTCFSDPSSPDFIDLDAIACESGLVIRKSPKFSPSGFLQSLLGAVVTGLASFNQLADSLKDFTGSAMARQSLHDRLSARSTAFLIGVLGALIARRLKASTKGMPAGLIKRILIEDSSAQAMPKSNAEHFPAHGNHHGATAGAKIDFAFDLLSGQILSHSLHAATDQDKSIGKDLLTQVQQGDLVLRDMGYFSLGEFDAIEKLGAYWLTRLPLTVGVKLADSEDSASLEHHLDRCKRDILDIKVSVGAEGKKCRLVALRAAPDVVEKRRAQRRKTAKDSGKTPCHKALIRDGWHLMLTNLGAEEMSAAQLVLIYRTRWAVEIQFRAWKQALNLDSALNRHSNEHHMMALILAGMIAHQLGMSAAGRIEELAGRARVSYEKLYASLATHLVKARNMRELCHFSPELRHVIRDKRHRQSPIESGILALT
jgi:hypothetical protein